jgi:hypothetical protein
MRRAAAGPEDLAFEFSAVVPALLPLALWDFFFSRAAKNAALFGSSSLGVLAISLFNHSSVGIHCKVYSGRVDQEFVLNPIH